MKYIPLILILLVLSVSSFGQSGGEWKFPFRVLYAENCTNNRGISLKSLDTVAINDIITIGERGILSLVHYTGFPIELNGDTTITIQTLQSIIMPDTKKRTKAGYDLDSKKFAIEYLFISDPTLAKKYKLSASGACHDCNLKLEILYPVTLNSMVVNFQKEICLTWSSGIFKKYTVQVTNLTEDFKQDFNTNTNSLTINAEEVLKLRQKESEGNLLFRIKDAESEEASKWRVLKYYSTKIEFPYACDLTKATFALMAGLHVEMSSIQDSDYNNEARKYFVLATELSDKPFYKEMLANFDRRHDQMH